MHKYIINKIPTGDLFIMIETCVGLTTVFGWADNRWMVQQCVTFFEHHSSSFEFSLPFQDISLSSSHVG